MKLLIGIPTLDNVGWEFFLHTTTLVARLSKKYDVYLHLANRMAIDRARQSTVDMAFEIKADRILFIDDDTLIPANTVELLEPLLKPVNVVSASGVSYQRGHPYMPMVYGYKDYNWEDGSLSNQLVDPFPEKPFRVSANGMGVSLLKVEMLRSIPAPCFGRVAFGTEDFYFYHKAWEYKLESWVHPGVNAVHLGDRIKVSKDNAETLRGESVRLIVEDNMKRSVEDREEGRATEGKVKV